MSALKLSYTMLCINIGCYVAGLLAYSSAASSAAIVNILMWSVFALVTTFGGAVMITRRSNCDGRIIDDTTMHHSSFWIVNVLLYLPVILVGYEAASIYGLNVAGKSVSWVNIAIAGYIGQNLEVMLRRD